MQKKILYVWKSEYPWDVRVEKICNSLNEAGYEVHILCKWNGEKNKEETIGGVHIFRVGFKEKRSKYIPISINPFWIREIKNAVKRIEPDFIIPREIMLATACGKVGRKNGIPVLMDMAENYPEVMRSWTKYKVSWWRNLSVNILNIPAKIEQNSLKYMSGVLTVCEEQSQRLKKVYNYHNSFILHNVPSLKWFSMEERNFKKEKFVFGYHGIINTERNLKILIDAFQLIDSKNIKLIISGDGPEYFNLKKYSEKFDNIELTGRFNHIDINQLYSDTDIGILPYKIDNHIENTISNKFFDYMAKGIPMIVSGAKPMRRLINQYKLGIVADTSTPEKLAESLISILDKDLDGFSTNGIKAFQSTFNWEKEMKSFLQYLNQINK